MTTAFNLSQLANNLDTSGRLDATDGLYGALSVANGGTGASTLTANNVILGNGTSAVQFVAPSTNGNVLTSNGTTWSSSAIPSQLIRDTAKNSTSGTLVDFTGIPSTVKRIMVMFNGISTSGTSIPIVQLGDSGGIEATGYVGGAGSSGGNTAQTIGIPITNANAASDVYSGIMIISSLGSNIWVASGTFWGGAIARSCASNKTLSSTLDRIRITTVNGTDTFDAGSINILYE